MKIRKAELIDVDIIVTITNNESLKNPAGETPSSSWISDIIKEDFSFVACDFEDNVIGAILAETVTFGGVILWFVAVENNNRMKGIGTELIKYLESYAKSEKRTWITAYAASVPVDLAEYYKKQGFLVGNKYYEILKYL